MVIPEREVNRTFERWYQSIKLWNIQTTLATNPNNTYNHIAAPKVYVAYAVLATACCMAYILTPERFHPPMYAVSAYESYQGMELKHTKETTIMMDEFGIPAPEQMPMQDTTAMAPQQPAAPTTTTTPATPTEASGAQGGTDRNIERIIARQKELLDVLTRPQRLFSPEQEITLKASRENFGSASSVNGKVPKYARGGGIQEETGYDTHKEKVVVVGSDSDFAKMKADGIKLGTDLDTQLEDVTDIKNRELLRRLSYAESSGGKLRIHENAGTSRAVSTFGLLPTQAVAEVTNQKDSRFADLFPEEMDSLKTAVAKKDWVAVNKITANPTFDAVLAEDYLNVLKKQINYEIIEPAYRDDALLYAWYKGRGGLNTLVKAKGYGALSDQSHVQRARVPQES